MKPVCVVFLLFAALFVASGCGPYGLAERTAAEDRVALARQKIQAQLAAGKYGAALGQVQKQVSGGLPEEALAEEYARALNGVLKQAEQYRGKGVPEEAGPHYRMALEAFPQTSPIASRSILSAAVIGTRIEACADELMDRGLIAYRSGDLDQAIKTWKAIRTFAPQHQESQKALQTAMVQRVNLEKVNAER